MVSQGSPSFFQIQHVPIKKVAQTRKQTKESSSDIAKDPRFIYCQTKPFPVLEREKNHGRMLQTDVGSLVEQRPRHENKSKLRGTQTYPVLFPQGVTHTQALQIDTEGDGMRPLPEKTVLPHNIYNMSDICGGRKPKIVRDGNKRKTNTLNDIQAVRELY